MGSVTKQMDRSVKEGRKLGPGKDSVISVKGAKAIECRKGKSFHQMILEQAKQINYTDIMFHKTQLE